MASISPVMSARRAAISRASVRYSPPRALPAGWFIGCSRAAKRGHGSEAMNRAGLVITLVIAVVVGVIFAGDPQLDLDISAPFFHAEPPTLFAVNAQLWVQATRWSARALIALLALPGFLAIIAKLILPHRRTLLEGRAALF